MAVQTLSGRGILLTRSAEDCAAWAEELERLGASPVVLPCIECEVLDTPRLRSELAVALLEADWLVFTSRRGVEALTRLAPGALAHRTRVAVVGTTTGEAARATLGRVDLVGAGTAQALAGELVAALGEDARVVLALAANAGRLLEGELDSAGAHTLRFNVYRTVPAAADGRKQSLAALGVDAVLFASPSAVEGFVNRVDTDLAVGYFTIGPATSKAANAHGLAVTGEARAPNLQGLLEAMHR